jgi:hypothetical protein
LSQLSHYHDAYIDAFDDTSAHRLLLQAAVVSRLADVQHEQHRPGLLRTVQLCEKLINSNASSRAALQVLQQEVAEALTKQQQQQHQVWIHALLCGDASCTPHPFRHPISHVA